MGLLKQNNACYYCLSQEFNNFDSGCCSLWNGKHEGKIVRLNVGGGFLMVGIVR